MAKEAQAAAHAQRLAALLLRPGDPSGEPLAVACAAHRVPIVALLLDAIAAAADAPLRARLSHVLHVVHGGQQQHGPQEAPVAQAPQAGRTSTSTRVG